MANHKPPLAVHFIWHPSDESVVKPLISELSTKLSRDVEKPFSRSLNLPLFFYSSATPELVPDTVPSKLAENDIVIYFASVNTNGQKSWREYGTMLSESGLAIVPFALSPEGLNLPSGLAAINAIRSYEWEEEAFIQRALIFVSHEIYRHGIVVPSDGELGKESSIKLFLSHAKSDVLGKAHALAVKRFVDDTNFQRFFDADEISAGFRFDTEIVESIATSTLIAFIGDNYSSRYWCQREVLCAKENSRPMISVNCMEDCEDRVFPSCSNVPGLRVPSRTTVTDESVLRILASALLETLRFEYSLASLKFYRAKSWISQDCIPVARPPEVRQILRLKKESDLLQICYPEPPIFAEESDWLSDLGVDSSTPLWSSADREALKNLNVGISISESSEDSICGNNVPSDQLTRLSQDIARHVLARAGQLHYGGDLRQNGFTEFILEEAVALKNRQNSDTIFVHNHLAWPLYNHDQTLTEWRAKYASIMNTICHPIPMDLDGIAKPSDWLAPTDTESKYVWSRCLTEMRTISSSGLSARVCVGGRLSGYKGKMPGVLEEILISIDQGLPVYLLGAFGGVVGEVVKFITTDIYPETLTADWQNDANDGYSELQSRAAETGHRANYEQCKAVLAGLKVADMANAAGLEAEEYNRLMRTPFLDEGVHLLIKGVKNVTRRLAKP